MREFTYYYCTSQGFIDSAKLGVNLWILQIEKSFMAEKKNGLIMKCFVSYL